MTTMNAWMISGPKGTAFATEREQIEPIIQSLSALHGDDQEDYTATATILDVMYHPSAIVSEERCEEIQRAVGYRRRGGVLQRFSKEEDKWVNAPEAPAKED